MDGDPAAVALKFAFLGVLYLFVIWILRGSLRSVRGSAPAAEMTGLHAVGPGGRAASTDASLVVLAGGGLEPGAAYDLFGGLSIGRSSEADLRIEDRFASQIHCRIYSRGPTYYVEDLRSTNGTFLNGEQFTGERALADLDVVRIGDTEFRFELDLAGAIGET
jgi:hypothetical protein